MNCFAGQRLLFLPGLDGTGLSFEPLRHFLFKHIVAGGPAAATLLANLWRQIRPRVSPQVLAHRLELVRQTDVRTWLPRLTLPCLYLQATGDRTVPPQALQDFTAALPHLQVVRIPGPHFILQAQPQASLTAVCNFVAGAH
jgi:pimeloyl-ACP methyl ester carboxylesterase